MRWARLGSTTNCPLNRVPENVDMKINPRMWAGRCTLCIFVQLVLQLSCTQQAGACVTAQKEYYLPSGTSKKESTCTQSKSDGCVEPGQAMCAGSNPDNVCAPQAKLLEVCRYANNACERVASEALLLSGLSLGICNLRFVVFSVLEGCTPPIWGYALY